VLTAIVPPAKPRRVLAVVTLAATVGKGIFLTAGVLYFIQAVHLPAVQVGLGWGAAPSDLGWGAAPSDLGWGAAPSDLGWGAARQTLVPRSIAGFGTRIRRNVSPRMIP
jgi:hypothetical protein